MKTVNRTPLWQQLQQQQQAMQTQTLREMFTGQRDRFKKYSLQAGELTLDFSKNLIDDAVLNNLVQLAQQADVAKKIQQLLAGDKVNNTEHRAAWHTKLRDSKHPLPEVTHELQKMADLAQQLAKQDIKHVVNLGIGGSDLGPALVVEALKPYKINQRHFYFVSNIDPSALNDVLDVVEPKHTLFIVASKSFTTLETLANANVAKQWLIKHTGDFKQAMFAVTTKPQAAQEFGIAEKNILQFWDWVGGRFSLWSGIGFAIVLAIGMENFKKFLHGAELIDQHFATAELHHNMPVIMALLSVWYINFWHAETQAIIPYDQHLALLPSYLQQLVMESNGKQARADGSLSTEPTAPVIWGQVGTNGQHAFHQLLHQGTHLIPIDFILPIQGHKADKHQQQLLVANCIAQSEALMLGRTSDDIHKFYSGNRPSNTILMPQLTPQNLGALIALYEHKTYVESIIWNINAFDQYGVELGKQLTPKIIQALKDDQELKHHDSSTQAQIQLVKKYS